MELEFKDNEVCKLHCSQLDNLSEAHKKRIDELGVLSGEAQHLSAPITSIEKMKQTTGTDSPQYIFIYTKVIHSNIDIVGYIKYSMKHLYFYTKKGVVYERDTLCVLDFYVLENLQRSGIGVSLFDYSIKHMSIGNSNNEKISGQAVNPIQLAYDRPSPKLIQFLKKHYCLINGDLQPNKYMIFDGF